MKDNAEGAIKLNLTFFITIKSLDKEMLPIKFKRRP